MKGKISEIIVKMKNKGYDVFGSDDLKKERRRRKAGGISTSSSRLDKDDQAWGVMAFLKRICCCCFYARPHHPLLASSSSPVVTHRKISRVASAESLTKDNLELCERPTHAYMTPQEKLIAARALHRLHSDCPPTPTKNGVTKPGKPSKPLTASQLSGLPPSQTSTGTTNSQLSVSTMLLSSSCQSLVSVSPREARCLPVTPSGSPQPDRSSRTHRPTHLSLSTQAARSRGGNTPSGGSSASTPTTPRSRDGNWGMMRTGFNTLMKAVVSSPHPPQSSGFPHPVESCSEDEDEELPEATCVRPATGNISNPAKECYGSITLQILGRQGRWVRVGVCGLAGLPWVGGSGGLMLEVSVEPGGRTRWLVLPHAHGPNVKVKLETVVKSPRESKMKKKGLVKVSVWVCGRVWRYAAIGHALMLLTDPSEALILPLHHHTQLTDDLGVVEVSLRCDYSDAEAELPGQTHSEVTLTLEVLRAKILRLHHPSVLSKARKKDSADVVCRVALWVKGERIERESSSPVQMPVTHDPVFRCRSVFILRRDSLQHAAIILKLLYTSKWGVEDGVGKVQLGPLLYLGNSPDNSNHPPPPDYNTSITLSHWGQALKTPGATTMWHHLQL